MDFSETLNSTVPPGDESRVFFTNHAAPPHILKSLLFEGLIKFFFFLYGGNGLDQVGDRLKDGRVPQAVAIFLPPSVFLLRPPQSVSQSDSQKSRGQALGRQAPVSRLSEKCSLYLILVVSGLIF